MSLARAFAPGKVILLGEHSVVYGHPALAGPLEQGVSVTLEPSTKGLVIESPVEAPQLTRAVTKCASLFGLTEVQVVLGGDLPQSVGLGSSAAVSVALVRAFAEATKQELSPERLLDCALELESEFHGAASGVDHNVAFERKLIRYVKGRRGQPLGLPRAVEAVVWVVEPRGSTREKVAALRRRREEDPASVDGIFEQIGELVETAVASLERGDLAAAGRAMDENQRLLDALDLSTPGIDAAIRRLRELGALGAKLTGAGGGGSVVGLFEDAGPVVEQLMSEGKRAFVARWEASR